MDYSTGQSQETSSGSGREVRPVDDMIEYLRNYAQEKPEVMALWCFGIGFVLGWKLKPW